MNWVAFLLLKPPKPYMRPAPDLTTREFSRPSEVLLSGQPCAASSPRIDSRNARHCPAGAGSSTSLILNRLDAEPSVRRVACRTVVRAELARPGIDESLHRKVVPT